MLGTSSSEVAFAKKMVKSETKTFVVETKGLEDLDDPLKIRRLRQWCADVNSSHSDIEFDFVYVDQEKFDRLTGAD